MFGFRRRRRVVFVLRLGRLLAVPLATILALTCLFPSAQQAAAATSAQPNVSNTIDLTHFGVYALTPSVKFLKQRDGTIVPFSATKCNGNVCQQVNGSSVCLNWIAVYFSNYYKPPAGNWAAEWLNGRFWDAANYGYDTPPYMPFYFDGTEYGFLWDYPGYYINGDVFQGGIDYVTTPTATIIYRGSCTPS